MNCKGLNKIIVKICCVKSYFKFTTNIEPSVNIQKEKFLPESAFIKDLLFFL